MIFIPGKPNYKPIKMQTRLGHDIDNKQVYDFSPNELNRYKDLEKDFRNVYRRNNPNPIYNCHGMTFACSRTQIDDKSVQMILDDDGYTEVKLDAVLPGDVVIYYKDLDVVHSGIVACVQKVGKINVPWVVSKWGKYSEIYHHELDCPYHECTRKYWRRTKLIGEE
jgi:hypothetical protein